MLLILLLRLLLLLPRTGEIVDVCRIDCGGVGSTKDCYLAGADSIIDLFLAAAINSPQSSQSDQRETEVAAAAASA